MTNLAKESKPYNMLQDKDIKKIQELKADYTPCRVSAEDIFSRFKALKLTKAYHTSIISSNGDMILKWYWLYWCLWWLVPERRSIHI